MKGTVIIWLFITGIILFAVTTFFMASLINTTMWQGMCNSAWEDGLIAVVIPFAILGFVVVMVIALFKGPDSRFRIGGPPGGE